MSRYQHRNQKIEAVQWFKDGDSEHVYMLEGDPVFEHANSVVPVDVSPGDWVVVYPNGDVNLYTDEQFRERFKPVEES